MILGSETGFLQLSFYYTEKVIGETQFLGVLVGAQKTGLRDRFHTAADLAPSNN